MATNLTSLTALPVGPVTSPLTNCQEGGEPAITDVSFLRRVPAKERPPIPCRLLTSAVMDAQGRRADALGVLYVVPPVAYKIKVGKADEFGAELSRSIGAETENIVGSATVEGGCSKHLSWQLCTTDGDARVSGASATLAGRAERPALALLPIAFPFSVSRMAALACEGGGMEYSIHTVAGDEVEFVFATDKIRMPFSNTFERSFKVEKNKYIDKTKKATQGKAKISQAWEEDKKSHRAFCKTKFSVLLDPLVSVSGKFLIYGVKIPPAFEGYLKAGLYIKLKLDSNISSNLELKTWADNRQTEFSGSMIGKATITVELSAGLTLLDPEIVNVEVCGETGVTGSFGLDSEAHGLRLTGKWLGLTASVTVHLFDGAIEYEREWKAFDDIEPLEHTWPIEALFGPLPAASAG